MAASSNFETTNLTSKEEEPFFSKSASEFSIKLTSQDKYWKLYKTSQLTDLTIVCQDQHFLVHRVILATESPSLLKSLSTDSDIKTINYDLDPQLMALTLECIYKGGMDGIPEHLAEKLAEISRLLGFTQMEQQCRRVYLSRLGATKENCLSACQGALALNADDILAKYQAVAIDNFSRLQSDDQFTSLDLKTAKWYLGHPDLSPVHPEDRLTAALLWLNSDIPARLEDFPSLLKCLPLSEMNAPFLRICMDNDSTLRNHPELQRVLLHAMKTKAEPPNPPPRHTPDSKSEAKPPKIPPRHTPDSKSEETPTKTSGSSESRGRFLETKQETCTAVLCKHSPDDKYKLCIFTPKFDAPIRETSGPRQDTLDQWIACCSFNHNLYMTCELTEVWQYKVMNNTWEKCGTMKHERYSPGLVVISGVMYIFGDSDSNDKLVRDVECMDVSTKTFQESGRLRGNECDGVFCCASGKDILVYGAMKKPVIGKKLHLLQVYSTISKSVLQSVQLPKDFSDCPLGIISTENDVVMMNYEDLYSCPLQSLYRGSSDQICLLRNYISPHPDCILTQGDNGRLLLVGGFAERENQVYQAKASDVTANQGKGWNKLRNVFSGDGNLYFVDPVCEIMLPVNLQG